MRLAFILLLVASTAYAQQGVPANAVAAPGNSSNRAVGVQGVVGGVPVAISGSISTSGAADAVSAGAPTTFNANTVCTGQLLLAGEQGAGFQLNSAGTLVGTLTPQYSMEASGSNWTTTQFIDQNGAKTASIIASNPTTLTQLGIVLVTGARRAQVCTTAFTSGSATGLATAAFVQGGAAAAGGSSTVNVTQFGGNNVVTGTGAGGPGIPRMTVSNDSQVKSWDGTNGATFKAASTPAATTDTAQVVQQSPLASPVCTSSINFSQTSSAQLIAGVTAKKVYVCSVVAVSATAQNISVVEGTGSVCATGIAGLVGGSTASIALAANGGFVSTSGVPWIVTKTALDNLCLLQDGVGNLSGVITYVIQ